MGKLRCSFEEKGERAGDKEEISGIASAIPEIRREWLNDERRASIAASA